MKDKTMKKIKMTNRQTDKQTNNGLQITTQK